MSALTVVPYTGMNGVGPDSRQIGMEASAVQSAFTQNCLSEVVMPVVR